MKRPVVMIRNIFFVMFALLCLLSCSENDNTEEEYPNWAATNDSYYNTLSDSVVNAIAQNPSQTQWKRIKKWSLTTETTQNSDYILVKVLEEGDNTEASPLSTDSVKVHYVGRYIPSRTYTTGYVFDRSYNDPFDAEVSVPTTMLVSSTVDGFSTALQQMHRGDHWLVYVPYQLGYGNPSSSTSIQSGSTLIFDLRLVDFFAPKKK